MIAQLYHLPLMDMKSDGIQDFTLIIKYPYMTFNINIQTIVVFYYYLDRVENRCLVSESDLKIIKNFIDDLKNNKSVEYKLDDGGGYSNDFIHFIVNDYITINTNNTNLILSLDNKPEFIRIMEKYYNMLLQYPQI
jgi:hypothetical protein